MAKRASALTVVLILLIIISLGLGGGFFYFLQKEQVKSSLLQKDLEDIKAKQIKAESNLEEASKMVADLDNQVTENKALIEALNKELEQEKAQKEEAFLQIAQLKTEIDNQSKLRSDLENKVTQAESTVKKMQEQLSAFDSKKTELEAKIKELEEKSKGVELGKIIVNPEPVVLEAAPPVESVSNKSTPNKKEKTKKKASSGLEGKVLVVNKDYNFVVINLGSKDGVGVGNVFSLYHGNKLIGEGKVEKIHDSMAAVGFVPAEMKEKISEGDKVVRKNK